MRELGASPLKTFSIGFADQTYNELAHARRIAERFETEHEEFIIEPQALELTEKLDPAPGRAARRLLDLPDLSRLQDGPGPRHGGPVGRRRRRALRRLRALPGPADGPPASASRPGGKAVGARSSSRLRPSDKKKGTWNKLRRFTQGFDHDARLRHLRWMMFLSRPRQGGASTRPA